MTRHHKPRRRNRLRWYRQRIGYTQEFVAELLGHKSNARVSDYEQGKKTPNLETALKLEIILCIPVSYLFPGQYKNFRRKINPMREKFRRKSVEQHQKL